MEEQEGNKWMNEWEINEWMNKKLNWCSTDKIHGSINENACTLTRARVFLRLCLDTWIYIVKLSRSARLPIAHPFEALPGALPSDAGCVSSAAPPCSALDGAVEWASENVLFFKTCPKWEVVLRAVSKSLQVSRETLTGCSACRSFKTCWTPKDQA